MDNSACGQCGTDNIEGKMHDGLYSFIIDKKAVHMMKKMGYKIGIGLGKYEQGIKKTIDINAQVGTIGFGFSSKEPKKVWDFSQETIEVEESLDWLESRDPLNLTFEKFQSFLKVGNPDELLKNSYNFCDRELYDNIVKAKEIFNEFHIDEVNEARTRANPFEKIRSVFFMNRAALKIANIDAATNFMFSNIDKTNYHSESKGPFYFADVCAGPGGFSEYFLWRRSWFFKGFGLTLKDANDFKLKNSCCISPQSFQAFYGTEGDGNVCSPENINDFKNKVLFQTNGLGVHFMTSDGGFCVDGVENMQEILSKNIYLCQCLVALEIVRNHGHFVTKLFDVFTRFSVGLIYLMYKCFEKVTILKPNSSRPANAERYLVCSNLQNNDDVDNIRRYLRFISVKLWELKDKEKTDVLEIIPMKKLRTDVNFMEFIKKSIIKIGKQQLTALKKLRVFCQNRSLRDSRQDELREKCLDYWMIPDKSRKTFDVDNEKLDDFLLSFIQDSDWLEIPPILIDSEDSVHKITENPDDFSFCALYSSSSTCRCNFYAGFASRTCRWQGGKWVKTKNLRLTKGTLLFAEIVKEVVKSDKMNGDIDSRFRTNLHIIDAMYLGNICLVDMSFTQRMELIDIYAKSINQQFQEKILHIKKKSFYPLSIDVLSSIKNNNFRHSSYLILPMDDLINIEESHDVNAIMFFKTQKDQQMQSTFVLRSQLYLDEIRGNNLFNLLIHSLEQKQI